MPEPRPSPAPDLLAELRERWRSESADHRGALIGLFVIGVVMRLAYLGQPMRYDESVTYTAFVRKPWSFALSDYSYPNNHVFHTFLAKASVSVFGNSPWALRLPAFFAGVVTIPATYVAVRLLYGARAALFATGLVAASGILIFYSTNARGYSLMALAFLVLVVLAVRLSRETSGAANDWMTFAVIAALGLWTLPVMMYPLGTVCLWFLLWALLERRFGQLRRFGIALGIAAALTLMAYGPVLSHSGLAAITRNKFVLPTPWFQFFSEMPTAALQTLTSWSLGIPPIVSLTLAAFVIIALLRHRQVTHLPVSLPLVAYVWSAWLLIVNHRAPFPRTWLWLYPLVAGLAAAGIANVFARRPRTAAFLENRWGALTVGFAIAAALSVLLSDAVAINRDTGTFRDAERVATVLKSQLKAGDRVIAGIPTNGPLEYWFDRLGVDSTMLTRKVSDANRLFLIVDPSENQSLGYIAALAGVSDTTKYTAPIVVGTFPSSAVFAVVPRARRAAP